APAGASREELPRGPGATAGTRSRRRPRPGPASRRPAHPRAARAGSAARPVPTPAAVSCSWGQDLRVGKLWTFDPACQPGFHDQDTNGRQNEPAPELLTALELGVVHLPELLPVDAHRRRIPQPAAVLFQRLH